MKTISILSAKSCFMTELRYFLDRFGYAFQTTFNCSLFTDVSYSYFWRRASRIL